jgi:hypothetical protein
VTRATYFGNKIEYAVQIASSSLIVEIYNPQLTEHFREGESVRAVLDPDCVRVLRDETQESE